MFENFDVLAQLVGLVGTALAIARYQFKEAAQLRRIGGLGAMVFATHYMMLGAYVGGTLAALAGLRGLVLSTEFGMKHRQYVLMMVIALLIPYGYFYAHTWVDGLVIAAILVASVAEIQKSTLFVRVGFLIIPPIWFVYNYMNGSIGGMLTDTFVFVSGLIGLYRHHIREQKASS